MSFEQAQSALEQSITETDSSASASQGQEGGQSHDSEPIDLDTVTKVKWEGKEYTPSDFRKMMMFQSDYTKKTQSVAQTQKYYEALSHDLEAIRNNPQLVSEFQKIYPKEFHKYLDNVMPKDWKTGNQSERGNLPPEVEEKLARFDSYIKEQEVTAQEAKIESITSKLAQKYPEAIEDVVLARAQALVEQGHSLTQEHWDKLYKTSHDFMLKRMTDRQTKQFDSQKNANLKGRGIGPGGGTPGQAPRKLSFKDATEAAIQDLTGKR